MVQIGIDFGGTKIEAAALDTTGAIQTRRRVANPGAYDAAIAAVVGLVAEVEQALGAQGSVGIGVPGSIDPRNGTMRNANAVFLNGRPFQADLAAALGRPVRVANDANCMALSEAVDGAAAGAPVSFGVIIGTGVGGGLVVDGKIVEGVTGVGGEWGHVPLPWMTAAEYPGPACWCGQHGCLDILISGTGLQLDHRARGGPERDGAAIVAAAQTGDPIARAAVNAFIDRLGRALAMVVNLCDPDIFVLGGGLSNCAEIYPRVPQIIAAHTFGGQWNGQVKPAQWGDSSGVRGAARLWP